jgi:hypothetical protein
MYRIQLELKDAIDTARAASYIDLHLKIYSEDWLWNKRDDPSEEPEFSFVFVCGSIFSFLCFSEVW